MTDHALSQEPHGGRVRPSLVDEPVRLLLAHDDEIVVEGLKAMLAPHAVLGDNIVGDDVRDGIDHPCRLNPVPRDRDRRRQL